MESILEIINQRIRELTRLIKKYPDAPNSSSIQARLTEAKHIQSLVETIYNTEPPAQHVIIDLRNMDFMKDKDGNINYYTTEEEACTVCGMNEFENAWVMKLIYNHIEPAE